MKLLNIKTLRAFVFFLLVTCLTCVAQEGHVVVNQDDEITELLRLKKELNSSENATDRYKIQIYSGSRSSAQSAKTKFLNSVGKWRPSLEYETPNYKIWVGNFRSRLEADRALKTIHKKFPNAFVFKPKKDKE